MTETASHRPLPRLRIGRWLATGALLGFAGAVASFVAAPAAVSVARSGEGLHVLFTGEMWRGPRVERLMRVSGAGEGLLWPVRYAADGNVLLRNLLCEASRTDPRDALRTVLTVDSESCAAWQSGEQPL